MLSRLLATGAIIGCALAPAAFAVAQSTTDPYIWLEQVSSPRAVAWVKRENAKTLAVLKGDSHFAPSYASALSIAQAKDRIAGPTIHNGAVYNFWQDASHIRGIWRTTSIADYASTAPSWKTVLDLDALAKSEGKNWVWEGANCNAHSDTHCLIDLSDGGEDATTVREFNLVTASFVSDGFILPHSKQNVAWLDDDTLLVAREWQHGDVTASGYPYIVKRVERGHALADAKEVFRGNTRDVSVGPATISDATQRFTVVGESPSFFENVYQILTPTGLQPLDFPKKANLVGMIHGRVLASLNDPWTTPNGTFAAGAVVSMNLTDMLADPAHLKPSLVWSPTPRQAFDSAATTRDAMLLGYTDNVRGRLLDFTPTDDGGWSSTPITVPDNAQIGIGGANNRGSEAYAYVTSFLAPTTLYSVDVAAGTLAPLKMEPARFDATQDVAEQFEATSKDGTRVPYFIVHAKSMQRNGKNPTILYGYGGFNVSLTPSYSATLGKLWLEHGGVYVLANIRGGGEFGPAWHEAGLKTHRQRIYDDFSAVARDVIAKQITSPRHLGIEGGSNGGLLMGVQFTQHPELWNAVDIQVPLLDMLRFEKIAAGASWVGEYGSVANPDERAFLASISPYNNLKPGVTYPKPLIWTTTKDDRVGPQHARKFAAKLAALKDPYYFYEVIEGGHGAGANAKEQAFTEALEYTYFSRQLN